MKIRPIFWLFTVSIGICGNAPGQAFTDLNFEQATIVYDNSSPFYPTDVYASGAIPGWTAFVGGQSQSDISYNSIAIYDDFASVSILEENDVEFQPLDGNYGIGLYGGPSTTVSLSQTGTVPAGTASILFIGQAFSPPAGTLTVSLGGQSLAYSALSIGPNYTTYGANIPAGMVGQSEPLAFTVTGGGMNYWEVDDIQFSPTAAPEPGVMGLFLLGGVFVVYLWRQIRPEASATGGAER